MINRNCRRCNKIFLAHGNAQYCSRECRIRTIKEKSATFIKTCKWCLKEFSGRNGSFCSANCESIYRKARAQKKKQTDNAKELAAINQLARDTGLSYGRYTGQLYAKTIKIHKGEN